MELETKNLFDEEEQTEGELPVVDLFAEEESLNNYSRGPSTRGKYKPPISKTETALRLGAKGVTSGLIDELAAASGTYGEEIADDDYGMRSKFSNPNFNPRSREELRGDYESIRDQIRSDEEGAAKANPKTALTAEIAGSMFSPINKTPLGLKKGDSLVKTAGKLAGQGAVYGAGTSEGETAGEVAKDAAISGTVSSLLGTPLTAITNKAFPALAKFLKEKVGFNALGGQTPQVKNLKKSGLETQDITDYALNPQKVDQVVTGTPIDDAAAKGSTVKVLQALSESGPEGMAKRNDSIKADAGRRIGEILQTGNIVQEVDNLGKTTQQELANAIKNQYQRELTGAGLADGGQLEAVNKVVKYLTDVDANGNLLSNNGKPFSLADLQKFRADLKLMAKFANKAPGVEDPGADVFKNMIKIADEQIQIYLDKAGQIIDPKLLPNFNEAKNAYRLAISTENIIDNALNKEAGLNTFGLSSRIAGQGAQAAIGAGIGSQYSDDPTQGALIGGLVAGSGTQVGTRLADRYGPALSANIGNYLKKAQPGVEVVLDGAYKGAPALFNHLKKAIAPNKKQDDEAAKVNAQNAFKKSTQ